MVLFDIREMQRVTKKTARKKVEKQKTKFITCG